ncbi:hypothetical protein [Sphingobium sp. CAP-1]|uniref:hypothetical protein n=1 Tax=Sphingobium sp. CAP-1 TaxID=2676077 RepID=UPI0012BB4403|nr:hypothetical protein [Sphingobium sp. CAP-1]QGP78029.1 hypothetical protein GL174_02695 [Sphingobium sp. CAP-1]
MIRTLIFGAITAYVGKKLYDEGKLTAFGNDLVTRYHEARTTLAEQRARTAPASAALVSPASGSTAPLTH